MNCAEVSVEVVGDVVEMRVRPSLSPSLPLCDSFFYKREMKVSKSRRIPHPQLSPSLKCVPLIYPQDLNYTEGICVCVNVFSVVAYFYFLLLLL